MSKKEKDRNKEDNKNNVEKTKNKLLFSNKLHKSTFPFAYSIENRFDTALPKPISDIVKKPVIAVKTIQSPYSSNPRNFK